MIALFSSMPARCRCSLGQVKSRLSDVGSHPFAFASVTHGQSA